MVTLKRTMDDKSREVFVNGLSVGFLLWRDRPMWFITSGAFLQFGIDDLRSLVEQADKIVEQTRAVAARTDQVPVDTWTPPGTDEDVIHID